MLQRLTASNGVVFYTSPLLASVGVPHAFSTRQGGASPAPFDSLNLGNPSGCDIQDDFAHIWKNYARLQSAARCAGRQLLRVHQVHGASVVRAQSGAPFDNATQADAIVTDDPACVASIRIADCVPILLSTADGQTVAAVHAGWKGIIAGAVSSAVTEMTNSSASAASLVSAIGPCIGFGAFEVGPEVIAAFRERFESRAPVRTRADGKGHVDLREAVRLQLLESGLAPEKIDLTDRCTVRDAKEFFSHRRDNGITGRMAAIIGPISR